MHSLQNFEFLNPSQNKNIQYIGLKFLGTVNRAKLFQYSELILNFFYNWTVFTTDLLIF